MNAELEALIRALDAVINARSGSEARQLDAIYQAKIDYLHARVPNVLRKDLIQMIAIHHLKWLKAQNRFPTIPPKA